MYHLRTSNRKRATNKTEDDYKIERPTKEIKVEAEWDVEKDLAVTSITRSTLDHDVEMKEMPISPWDSMDACQDAFPFWGQEQLIPTIETVETPAEPEEPPQGEGLVSTIPYDKESIDDVLGPTFEYLRGAEYHGKIKTLIHYMAFLPRNILQIHHRLCTLNAEYEQIKQEYIQEKQADSYQYCAFNTLKLYIENPSAVPAISLDELATAMVKQEPAKRAMESKRIKLEMMEHEIRSFQCQLSQWMGKYSCCADFTNKIMQDACALQEKIYALIEELKMNY